MAPARKFLFDTSFDASPAAADDEGAQPAEPTYSAAELEQARQQAYAEGEATAHAAARAATERTIADALQRLADQSAQLLQQQESAGNNAVRASLATAVAILRKLQPELARRKGLAEVEGILRNCFETMREEPRILVRVHDTLLDPLRDRLEQLMAAAGYEGRVVILTEDTLAPGDCRIEWADGGVERDTERLWRDIEAALARALADAPHTVDAADQ